MTCRSKNKIFFGENLEILRSVQSESADLIYIDPPFNTGRTQSRKTLKTIRNDAGDRNGFGGHRYISQEIGRSSFEDQFEDYLGFLRPRIVEARRILKPTGSFFFHVDYREVHYCKVLIDEVFGRGSFRNEIIWAYDYGARSKNYWPAKHDNLLWYSKHPTIYTFNLEECDRIPYMAPGLVGEEKAALGKTPTDVWWHTIVSPTGREKTGYPTQKPLGILERIVKVHSNKGQLVLDFFAGSGTTGEAAARNGRHFILIDQNPEAISVMTTRLEKFGIVLQTRPQKPGLAIEGKKRSTIEPADTDRVCTELRTAIY